MAKSQDDIEVITHENTCASVEADQCLVGHESESLVMHGKISEPVDWMVELRHTIDCGWVGV